MTDCYICGHPILEGQRTQEFYAGDAPPPERSPDDHRIYLRIPVYKQIHMNPADHLPTLGGNMKEYEDALIFNERERAARMIQELAHELMEQKIRSTAAMGGALTGLADRIRNGDE